MILYFVPTTTVSVNLKTWTNIPKYLHAGSVDDWDRPCSVLRSADGVGWEM